MSHATVAQAQMIAAVLQHAVSEFKPNSLALLGAAGGNGLECVDARVVRRIVALDLNPEFLALCTKRHGNRFIHYEAILHDLADGAPPFEPVSLIFAGLILEYLDCFAFFKYLPALLSPRGVFIALMQLPSSELPRVSVSPFSSLKPLESVFHFVDPAAVRTALTDLGFSCCEERVIRLESRKQFHRAVFRLPWDPADE